jgi:hypothetical protein
MTALDGADRYLAWQAEIQRIGAPDLVLARSGLSPDNPELLVRTDSALTVRTLFDGLRRDHASGPMVLTELPGDPATWPVRDGAGAHYLSELAVTWFDPPASPELPPDALFPGGARPGFYAGLTSVLANRIPRFRRPRPGETPRARAALAVMSEIVAVYAALVPDRRVRGGALVEAADWLTRSAERQPADPGKREDDHAPAVPAGALEELARLSQSTEGGDQPDIAQFQRPLEDYVRVTAAQADIPVDLVRAQIVGRLAHAHAVRLAGEWLDLITEAELLRSLARATST